MNPKQRAPALVLFRCAWGNCTAEEQVPYLGKWVRVDVPPGWKKASWREGYGCFVCPEHVGAAEAFADDEQAATVVAWQLRLERRLRGGAARRALREWEEAHSYSWAPWAETPVQIVRRVRCEVCGAEGEVVGTPARVPGFGSHAWENRREEIAGYLGTLCDACLAGEAVRDHVAQARARHAARAPLSRAVDEAAGRRIGFTEVLFWLRARTRL